MQTVIVRVKRVRQTAEPLPLPRYQTVGAAGMDLLADESISLRPGQWALVPTGLAVEIPSGFEAQIRPRSGLALRHGIGLLNAPGTIDADYRGEVQVLLVNFGADEVLIRRGDRIAQMVVAPVVHAVLQAVDELTPTNRGPGGFGHTGD